jgi:3-hydroxyisobutyrate dehydrogenase-like beta-hydroxyacid dehydrogenase
MRISFIGLGMMAHHMVANLMVANLQKAGHDLRARLTGARPGIPAARSRLRG